MLCEKNECMGCAACEQICPHNAITMQFDEEGFITPIINESICTKCGLCDKSCPILNKPKVYDIYPKAYAFYNKNEEELKKSASGGAFLVFAKKIIEEGGVVFGAVYYRDFSVHIKSARTYQELIPMLSSKYVESYTDNSYKEVKELLKSGIKVLYSGLPCQVAGLYSYLGNKVNLDNLYTLDLICHGKPSYKLLKLCIEYEEKKRGSKLLDINFRDKKDGLSKIISYSQKLEFEDGIYYPKMDGFLYSFIFARISSSRRDSCFYCHYTTIPRTSDISIGDYFGYGVLRKYGKSKFNNNGLSQLIVNTKKGQDLLLSSSDKAVFEERQLEECLIFNDMLSMSSFRSKLRNTFYNNFNIEYGDKLINSLSIKTFLKYFIIKHISPNFIAFSRYLFLLLKGKNKEVQKLISKINITINSNGGGVNNLLLINFNNTTNFIKALKCFSHLSAFLFLNFLYSKG